MTAHNLKQKMFILQLLQTSESGIASIDLRPKTKKRHLHSNYVVHVVINLVTEEAQSDSPEVYHASYLFPICEIHEVCLESV